MDFWEKSFRENQEMWGMEPTYLSVAAAELFAEHGLHKVLIPGYGYGRNAKIFTDKGLIVTGIEISATAIALAKKHYGEEIKVYHGSVVDMPFDQALYDGIYCYALLHLFNAEERIKLIRDCYNQLAPNGYMVFIVISQKDARYGRGHEISKDRFDTYHGVSLYFYNAEAIEAEFFDCGLIEAKEVDEPFRSMGGNHFQRFWQIVCRKEN